MRQIKFLTLTLCLILANTAWAETAAEPDQCVLDYAFSEIPKEYQVIETPHVKVWMSDDQYYLGRLIFITKADKKDRKRLKPPYYFYPDMEWIHKNRPGIYNEVMTVVYAASDARRAWLKEAGLPEPAPFNEMMADNLAYPPGQTKDHPAPHAHVHSWMRYEKPIRLSWDEGYQSFKLEPANPTPPNPKSQTFIDTEYGHMLDFSKKYKPCAQILNWIAASIAQHSETYLRKAHIKIIDKHPDIQPDPDKSCEGRPE